MYCIHTEGSKGGHCLTPLHTRGNEATEEVVGAIVKRRHVLPVVIDTESLLFDRVLQALHQTIDKVKAHVWGLLNRVVAVETTVKRLTMRRTSEDRQAGSKQEKKREESGSTHSNTSDKRVRRWPERLWLRRILCCFYTTTNILHTGIY